MSVDTESKTENANICAVCKISTEKKCTGCDVVYYCSLEHQKSDWKTHSKSCRPFNLVYDPMVGRRYIATRRIETEEIVLRENRPLLVIPRYTDSSPFTCLNCYVPLMIPEDAKQCDKCGLHMCLNCTKHGPECELTLKYRRSRESVEDYTKLWSPLLKERLSAKNRYKGKIYVLRALALRESNPKAYQRLLKLQGHSNEFAKHNASIAAEFVKIIMNIDLDEGKIADIIGIVEMNAFGCGQPNLHGVLFDKASYFEHSCRPNCFTTTRNDIATIRAVVPIPEGHPIAISYIGPFSCIKESRSVIAQTRLFDCCCERCNDPTEFGTMFSAVKCNNDECAGYMLPPTFAVPNGEKIPDFVCDKCNVKKPSDVIDTMLNGISEEYLKITPGSIIELKAFIDKNEKILHENHCVLFPAKVDLAEEVASLHDIATPEILKENIKLCEKINYLMETLMPDRYFQRGVNLFRTFLCSHALLLKEQPSSYTSYHLSHLRENEKVLIETCRLLSHHDDPLMKRNPEITLARLRESMAAIELEIASTSQPNIEQCK